MLILLLSILPLLQIYNYFVPLTLSAPCIFKIQFQINDLIKLYLIEMALTANYML